MATPKVDNPSHRSKYEDKTCSFCGKTITEEKWVTKQTQRSKKRAEFRRYHTSCYEGLFN